MFVLLKESLLSRAIPHLKYLLHSAAKEIPKPSYSGYNLKMGCLPKIIIFFFVSTL